MRKQTSIVLVLISFSCLSGCGGNTPVPPTLPVTEFQPNGYSIAMTTGPDGDLWFIRCTVSLGNCLNSVIGRITPAGQISQFPLSDTEDSAPDSITARPDGNLWFTENPTNLIGRMTPSGEFEVLNTTTSFGWNPTW